MSTLETINKEERLLLAAKNNLQYLKNRRWVVENYKSQPTTLNPDIEQTEAAIIQHRRTLKNFYETILN